MRDVRITADGAPRGGVWTLTREAAHYLVRVRRVAPGARVELIDQEGTLWQGRLSVEGSEATLVEVAEVVQAEVPTPLIVAAALIKPARWDWMLEKAAELGATHVQPLVVDRVAHPPQQEREASKRTRWQAVCDAATRQCRRLHRCEVLPTRRLPEAIAALDASVGLYHLDECQPDAAWPSRAATGASALFVGPEGGFTMAERDQLVAAGAAALGLGAALLRAETAAIAALALVRLRRDAIL